MWDIEQGADVVIPSMDVATWQQGSKSLPWCAVNFVPHLQFLAPTTLKLPCGARGCGVGMLLVPFLEQGLVKQRMELVG